MVAAALLFPVLIFIATATRLSAARREQRFAAMRLVGATPRQVSVIAGRGVDGRRGRRASPRASACSSRCAPALAAVPFTGEPFFPGDLSLSLPDILVVALGVPVAAAVAARLALRRVQHLPARRHPPGHPDAAAGLAAAPAAGWPRPSSAFFVVPAARRPRPARSRRTCPASC